MGYFYRKSALNFVRINLMHDSENEVDGNTQVMSTGINTGVVLPAYCEITSLKLLAKTPWNSGSAVCKIGPAQGLANLGSNLDLKSPDVHLLDGEAMKYSQTADRHLWIEVDQPLAPQATVGELQLDILFSIR